MVGKTKKKATKPKAPNRPGTPKPKLLSGGNPQIPKGDGDAPVQAYIAAMPGWKGDVGRRLDALITRTVPNVRKAVRWNSPFYGVDGQGWFLSFHCFDKYVKVTVHNGASLKPLPPIESKHPTVRYFHVYQDEAMDEALVTRWIKQASQLPGEDLFETNVGSRAAGVRNPKIDALFEKSKKWKKEKEKLRTLLLDFPFLEELKWGKACYTFQQGNVALILGLKNYCALGFLKGSLLKDPQNILVSPGQHSQSMRQIRFTEMKQITDAAPTLKAYIREAIEVERARAKVDFKESRQLSPTEELEEKFAESPAFKAAFYALTPGRQRGYLIHFTNAKQAKTRVSRIDKCMHKIFEGKGFNER